MPVEFPHPALADVGLDNVLAALSDPSRRRIVLELVHGDETERACASFELPRAKSTRTYHWRVLREAGLIRQRDAGNGTFVRLREDFGERFPGLLDVLGKLDSRHGET
ncbi:helix-turn-helix transcriptional regulator [Amycolatopsis sp.]|uniref:ArsR/SmtB family transcription factor n=1 Tax=Amycolatopsis sp. TaxID=37632 RepID=UPI002C66E3F9|nr:helix-turn-helix transcriptional regulator [Amycolatopsis sp.]HVV09067.1 helix-turn-helix transcriptional regulator [Amycolatopsis sp.]